MTKPLFKHYELLLAAAEYRIAENGDIYALNSKSKTGNDKVVIEGKRLVMPFIERLREPDDGSTVFFHPFSEEFGKGESHAIAALRARFTKVIAMRLGLLQVAMAQLASTATPPKVLDTAQQEGLLHIKECTPKVFEEIRKIVEASGSAANQRKIAPLVLFLSRKSPPGDETYLRWLSVRFPLYEALLEQRKLSKSERNIYSVKASDDTLKVLIALYEMILPKLKKDPAAYSCGSNSNTAPYSDALMRGVSEIFLNINEVARIYAGIGLFDECITDEGWTDAIEELDLLNKEIILIPSQGETSGLDKVEDKISKQQQAVMESNLTVTATPTPTQALTQAPRMPEPAQQPAYQAPQPVPYQQPASQAPAQQASSSEAPKLSFRELTAMMATSPMNPPAIHYPQQVYQQPAPQQPQPMTPIGNGLWLAASGAIINSQGQQVGFQQPAQPSLYGTPDWMQPQHQVIYQQASPGGSINPYNTPPAQPVFNPAPGQYPPGYPQPHATNQYQSPVYQQPYQQPQVYQPGFPNNAPSHGYGVM